jgi:UDP-2,3-diacylglucosamine pyrophosphatase LpxH
MSFAFDLISDLHVESWDSFDWTGQPTAPYCVVAGDVGRERDRVIATLEHLGEQYAGVFYIDGNDEHKYYMDDLGGSYRDLIRHVKQVKNVVYMQDNVIIINGVAILATNGWWSYDFGSELDPVSTQDWFENYTEIDHDTGNSIPNLAWHDASYLTNSVSKLQTHKDVKSIVVVSHTLPAPWIAEHDLDIVNTPRFNCLGNQELEKALDMDTENKISTWCFGHYHRPIDREYNNVRYVSNPRGRGNTPWSQSVFFPKRIEVKF